MISSRTVFLQICRSGFWNRKPTCFALSLTEVTAVSAPWISTRPLVGFSNPSIRRTVVVFPVPLAPRSATNSPFSSRKDTSCTDGP